MPFLPCGSYLLPRKPAQPNRAAAANPKSFPPPALSTFSSENRLLDWRTETERGVRQNSQEGETTMRKIGLIAIGIILGFGLTQNSFGQGPGTGMCWRQSLAMQPVGPGGRGAGAGFNYRRAALGPAWNVAAPGSRMRGNAGLGPGRGRFCPFISNNGAASTTGSNGNATPGFGPGTGLRRNAPVAPGMGPFCPFRSGTGAATANPAGTGAQAPGTSNSNQAPQN